MMHAGEMEATVRRLSRRRLLEQQWKRVLRLAVHGPVPEESGKLLREMERSLRDLECHFELLLREQAKESGRS